jgi:hypothetical protein
MHIDRNKCWQKYWHIELAVTPQVAILVELRRDTRSFTPHLAANSKGECPLPPFIYPKNGS